MMERLYFVDVQQHFVDGLLMRTLNYHLVHINSAEARDF